MATTYYHRREPDRLPRVILWLLTGVVCLLAGWLLPVSYHSIHPGLLEYAGRQGHTIDQLAEARITAGQLGPATLYVDLAKALRTPGARELELSLLQASERDPWLAFWGGRDAQIETLFGTNAQPQSMSLLQIFMSDQVRQAVQPHLNDSISPHVRSIVRTRELTGYQRFVPANKPGGQPLDATIVLTSLFCASERFTPTLVAEITTVADRASAGEELAPLEEVYYSILVLGNRLNWGQLTELLGRMQTTSELKRFAKLINDHPDDMALIYCGALSGNTPHGILDYYDLLKEEAPGHLRRAAGEGVEALRLILDRQVPIADTPGIGFPLAAQWVIDYPLPMYVAKWALFGMGALALIFAWANLARRQPAGAGPFPTPAYGNVQHSSPARASAVPYASATVSMGGKTSSAGMPVIARILLVVIVLGGLALLSEPLLMKRTESPAPQPKSQFAGLSNSPLPAANAKNAPLPVMDQSTIISIMLFGLLQILVYMICLMKIREIDLQPCPANLKLRLMENEENLFDSGLYVGIAGTAAALVLQVMQVIEANLLAAYSSNLFGITCVALVKIGHVRAFKRNLILQAQAEDAVPQTA